MSFSIVQLIVIHLYLMQGSLLPLSPSILIQQEDYRDAIKAALDIFKIDPSANALDTAILNGVKSDICAWVCTL